MKPKALDLFCCAGGAGMGLHRAGFDVTGIDIRPQPRYPFQFICGDALNPPVDLKEFDFIWASPPCQAHSSATHAWRAAGREYPDLIAATRAKLTDSGKKWCIENVGGAPLINPVALCGPMFGLRVYRHRYFETNFPVHQPNHPPHLTPQVKMGRPPKEGEFVQAVGHFSGVPEARAAMGIPWMGQKELAQAIPPAYSEFIAREFLKAGRL